MLAHSGDLALVKPENMFIVLDSSVICADLTMSSTSFHLLFEALRVLPAQLYLPEVVIEEVTNKFHSDLAKHIDDRQKLENAIKRLGLEINESPLLNCQEESEKYRRRLLAQLEILGGKVIAYPKTDHQKVVQRDLKRMKPFKSNGTGYRDFLIWESVKSLGHYRSEQVVFITDNTSDFCLDGLIHPELIADVPRGSNITISTGLKAFLEKYVDEKLKMLSAVQQRILEESGLQLEVSEWVSSNLIQEFWNIEGVVSLIAPLPPDAASAYPSRITNLKSVEIGEVRELTADRKLIEVNVEAEVIFSVNIDGDDLEQYPELVTYLGSSEPFHYCSTDETCDIGARFKLIVDISKGGIESSEVTMLSGPEDTWHFN